ncbi:hypothetical protein C8J57DRAFT_1491456 [Mycena rebaudengoi]|nr:hypothetical protein C8J57DRAFT_1491456 [Mycena rebaudengoi]
MLRRLPTPIEVSPDNLLSADFIDSLIIRITDIADADLQFDIDNLVKTHLLRNRLEPGEGNSSNLVTRRLRHYLTMVVVPTHRKALTGLYLGDHSLSVERLRYSARYKAKVPREYRLCRFCRRAVEDEVHALFDCTSQARLVDLRTRFLADLANRDPTTRAILAKSSSAVREVNRPLRNDKRTAHVEYLLPFLHPGANVLESDPFRGAPPPHFPPRLTQSNLWAARERLPRRTFAPMLEHARPPPPWLLRCALLPNAAEATDDADATPCDASFAMTREREMRGLRAGRSFLRDAASPSPSPSPASPPSSQWAPAALTSGALDTADDTLPRVPSDPSRARVPTPIEEPATDDIVCVPIDEVRVPIEEIRVPIEEIRVPIDDATDEFLVPIDDAPAPAELLVPITPESLAPAPQRTAAAATARSDAVVATLRTDGARSREALLGAARLLALGAAGLFALDVFALSAARPLAYAARSA